MGRKKGRGHFCWCCGAMRPNEAFSGGGHARHLCKQCAKLGADELAYRFKRAATGTIRTAPSERCRDCGSSTKQAKSYDEAVKVLVDLRDLDARGGGGNFRLSMEALRQAQVRKPSFIERIRKAGL